VAGDHRRALAGLAVGIIVVMIILLAALAAVKPHYLNQISNATDRGAATAIASQVQSGLNAVSVGLMILGALTLVATLMAGPSGWTARFHRAVSIPGHLRERKSRNGAAAAAVPAWSTRNDWLLRLTGLCAAILLLLYMPQASAAVVLAVSIVFGVYLGAVEILS
jgi:hypothetical protein